MGSAGLTRFDAPGLSADWLNAWLAAIGVCVLLPDAKLSWTDDIAPHAVFWVTDGLDLAEGICSALPSLDALNGMAIAVDGPGGQLGQAVKDVGLYEERAKYARTKRDWTLGSAYTDLTQASPKGDAVGRGQFYPGMEGSETLWKRLRKCLEAINNAIDKVSAVRGTLRGASAGNAPLRAKINGLGFDARRLANSVETGTSGWPVVDPVVEALAFFSLKLLPVRATKGDLGVVVQKPWIVPAGGGKPTLRYPCWSQPLDAWGIDALLDVAAERVRAKHPTSLLDIGVKQQYDVRLLRKIGKQTKSAYFAVPAQ